MARTRYDQQLYRLNRLAQAGRVNVAKMPTQWQFLQAQWCAYAFLFTRREEDRLGSMDTWLSRMPQRVIAQLLAQTFFPQDPTGLTRTREGLIWHVLSLNHYGEGGFTFDLEMLSAFENGLDDLIGEARAMKAHVHPWWWLARQMVGEEGYWDRVIHEAKAAQEGRFPGSFRLSRIQGAIDDVLSFPATPWETLQDKGSLERLAISPIMAIKHALQTLSDQPVEIPGALSAWQEGEAI